MNINDLKRLDPKYIGNWPISVKALIIIILCLLTLFAGYWFDTQNQMTELENAQEKEEQLKKTFKRKQLKAATLPKLKEQLIQIEFILEELFKKLPSDAQVDELIRDISQTILASGLKQELFQPQYGGEKSEKGIYVKLPIRLRARGDYHAFGKFVSGIAAMNRIVTQHNISIKRRSGANDTEPLILEMTAQVYRYLEKKSNKKAQQKK